MTTMPAIDHINMNRLLSLDEFTPLLNRTELSRLEREFPGFPVLHTEFEISEPFNQYLLSKKARRGEVVFALQNPDLKILLHTKPQFPDGLYRLLTGGIDRDEPVLDALKREVYEETGFKTKGYKFKGIVAALLSCGHDIHPFLSYTFVVPVNGEPHVMDKSENISGFKWASRAELDRVYKQLIHLQQWPDWGLLRSLPHLLLVDV